MKQLLLVVMFLLVVACSFPMLDQPPASASATPAAPSPTLVVSPAVTATPTPLKARHYFFEDDFDGGFLGWTTQVIQGDPGLLDLNAKDGHLVFDIGQQNMDVLAFFQAGAYKNVWIDLRVINQSESRHAVNLICRYTETEGWYQFEVFDSGLSNLYYAKWDEDQKQPQRTLLTEGRSNTMRTGNAANDLTMICKDRAISLYINGMLAVTYEDNQYILPAGQVGIGVSSFNESPLVVKLDWFKLETP